MCFSPLEQFSVFKLISLNLFGLVDFSFTNSSFIMLTTVYLFYLVFTLGFSGTVVPTRWQSVLELYYGGLYGVVSDNLGDKGREYFPFIYGLFTYIVILNLLGMIPYNLTVTSHIVVTFGLSLSIWLGVTILGFVRHKLDFFSMFMPSGAPLLLAPLLVLIELLSYTARAVSLGVRLAANMTAGHILLAIMSRFAWTMLGSGGGLSIAAIGPIFVLVFIIVLELAVAVIQAFVFTLLTSIFLSESISLH